MTADDLRELAKRKPNRRAARRQLAIANELDGYNREEAVRRCRDSYF